MHNLSSPLRVGSCENAFGYSYAIELGVMILEGTICPAKVWAEASCLDEPQLTGGEVSRREEFAKAASVAQSGLCSPLHGSLPECLLSHERDLRCFPIWSLSCESIMSDVMGKRTENVVALVLQSFQCMETPALSYDSSCLSRLTHEHEPSWIFHKG